MLPQYLIDKYAPHDGDTDMFLKHFDEAPCKVLEVGAHDEAASNLLSEADYQVTGVDLRDYDPELPPCNYTYLKHDFNNLPKDYLEAFDTVIALSCLEHFGLDTYWEGFKHTYYDIIGAYNLWRVLKSYGTAYVTVPFGRSFVQLDPHWRVYSKEALQSRIIQDFTVEKTVYFFAEKANFLTKGYATGQIVDEAEAMEYPGGEFLPIPNNPLGLTWEIYPHCTVFLKLRKVPKTRLSPPKR